MKKLKKQKTAATLQEIPVVRYSTDVEHGLSEEQVAERIEHKLVNDTKIRTSNSYLTIFMKNIFTVFNCIWLFIAIALICVHAPISNLLFLLVVIANTAISIFQEIKAKITVEKLSMVTTPKIKAVRMGLDVEVRGEDLLLDDIILLENGNQIPADCIIVDGNVEANESLLTGESNSVKKVVGDILLAGSFLVSGKCYARVDKVGKSNYIQTVAETTKDFKPQTSNLFKDLNSLIKVILVILIPLGVLTFIKEMTMTSSTIEQAVTNTSGAVTGMIPAGMYLLITVGLSVGVIKLARKKTLVKNLYSIEMLARANILCLDKTGTITDGTMRVVQVLPQEGTKPEQVGKIMKTILASQATSNATSLALVEHFGKEPSKNVKEVIEFSSSRKFSVTMMQNGKTYYLGALPFIRCNLTSAQKNEINSLAEQGLRVMGLVEDTSAYNEKVAGKKGKVLALFALEDHIRKDAVETIAWFKQNEVKIKIISGDDALTVSRIAKRVGVDDCDKYVSLENMSLQEVAQIADKFTVFGRVTPEQKHTIIKALKTSGNVVAMTGDGVNDTLALKEANCSIAMADGSEVARNISHLVLMESNFSALPAIVREGRQIVNNVQSSSVLYLMKTLFTIMLCVFTLIIPNSYPFVPAQILLLEMFIIGIPSFILTFQPNNDIIRGNFIPQVLKKSIPCALLMFVNILVLVILNDRTVTLNAEEFASLCTLLLTFVGFINLVWVCWPLNWLRAACVGASAVLIVSALAGLGRIFLVTAYTFPVIVTLLTLLLCSILIVVCCFYLKQWYFRRKQELIAMGVEQKSFVLARIWQNVKPYRRHKSDAPENALSNGTNETNMSKNALPSGTDVHGNASPASAAGTKRLKGTSPDAANKSDLLENAQPDNVAAQQKEQSKNRKATKADLAEAIATKARTSKTGNESKKETPAAATETTKIKNTLKSKDASKTETSATSKFKEKQSDKADVKNSKKSDAKKVNADDMRKVNSGEVKKSQSRKKK